MLWGVPIDLSQRVVDDVLTISTRMSIAPMLAPDGGSGPSRAGWTIGARAGNGVAPSEAPVAIMLIVVCDAACLARQDWSDTWDMACSDACSIIVQ